MEDEHGPAAQHGSGFRKTAYLQVTTVYLFLNTYLELKRIRNPRTAWQFIYDVCTAVAGGKYPN